ncbi:MAG: bifunctional DNA primase/polymerase [Propionibacteriaceae bacterium]|nr:bifunctional DNA primase/polymerase [Propionibacteriaceae bacterium]
MALPASGHIHPTTVDVAAILARPQELSPRGAALAFARSGLPVFPCLPGRKTPLTRHGFLDATASLRQVESWWGRWPDANLGLPTGPMSGVDVIDIDVRPTGDGYAVFDRVERQIGADGWAARVTTPSGGTHLYYPADPGRPQSSWACGSAHVDFRGTGGYIIVPPSAVQIGGQPGSYRLTGTQADPRPVDAKRLRDALDPVQASRRLAGQIIRRSSGTDTSRLASWVAGRPEGERNQGLFWAACRLAETGHDRDTTLSVLAAAAQDAGLLDREICTTVTSAYRHAHPATSASSPPTAPAMTAVPMREAVAL